MLTRARLVQILDAMQDVRIGIIGDAGLDVYWEADMTRSRLARENPYHILPVIAERLSPGGGGNTAACVAALGVASATMVSVVGMEWRGRELTRSLQACGVNTEHLLESSDWVTVTFAKTRRCGLDGVVAEDAHAYFENYAPLPEIIETEILADLDELCDDVDALIVPDYQQFGVVTPAIRARLCKLGAAGKLIIVDSRDRIAEYAHVILKPNELEASRALGGVPGNMDHAEMALALSRQGASPVCLTHGAQGCLWTEGETVIPVPAKPASGPVDPVGAGDCFAASLACALAAGATGPEAAAIANLSAGVIVRKLGTTGTATPAEILDRFDKDYTACLL